MLHIRHKLRQLAVGVVADTHFVHMRLRTTLPVADDVPQFSFDHTLQQKEIVDALDSHGVVVVNNVLPDADCDAFQKGMLAAFAACNSNWRNFALPGINGHGLMKYCGIALSSASQAIRTHPNVMRLGMLLYDIKNTQDMVCSLDAPALGVTHQLTKAPKTGDSFFAGSSLKPHVDLAKSASDAKPLASETLIPFLEGTGCPFPVQMQVLTVDQTPDGKGGAAPGFVAAQGWHNKLKIKVAPTDFRCLDVEEMELVKPALKYIPAKRGSVILWHSGLPHCSYRGNTGHPAYKDGLCRATQMVCYAPKQARTEHCRKRKLACFGGVETGTGMPKEGACTTHWPHVAVTAGPGFMSNPLDDFRKNKAGETVPILKKPRHWKLLPPELRQLTQAQEALL
jgi:hypothetical protein